MKNVYFVLYGDFDYESGEAGAKFGEQVGIGWTIGEEILFSKAETAKRCETVRAIGDACLI